MYKFAVVVSSKKKKNQKFGGKNSNIGGSLEVIFNWKFNNPSDYFVIQVLLAVVAVAYAKEAGKETDLKTSETGFYGGYGHGLYGGYGGLG